MAKTANQITNETVEYLNLQGHYVYRQNNIPTRRRKGVTHRGVADIMGVTKKGKALAVEVKTTDKQSEYQKEFQQEYEKRGGIYLLIHDLQDVIEAGL